MKNGEENFDFELGTSEKELMVIIHLENVWSIFFQVRRLQSVSIFSSLSHPCFVLVLTVYYYLFGTFVN